MNEHEATEIAYKNGYKQGMIDGVQKMQERLNEAFNHHSYNCRDCIKKTVDKIAKETLEGK